MKRLTVLAGAVLAVALVSGCSASVEVTPTSPSPAVASPTGSPSGVSPSGSAVALSETYTDAEYGFTFKYAPPFELNDQATFAGKGGGASAKTVAVFDTEGAQIGGQYRDAFVVSVYPLKTTITEENLPQAKAELESNVIPQLKQTTPGMEITPLTETTVAGKTAYTAEASFDLEGTRVNSRLYFIFDGATEYQILAQAVETNWAKLQPTFDAMLKSFTLGAGTPSPKTS